MSSVDDLFRGIQVFDLKGKKALVTGGSKGLGFAMAAALSAAGADVLITSRNAEEIQAAAEQISSRTGNRVLGIASDATKPDDVERLAEVIENQLGGIDILVNNAGINIRGPIDQLSVAEFRQVMETNVVAPWLVSRAVVPMMKKQRGGRIINLASTLGVVGLANRTPYASSKGAIVQMTRALALELAEFAITVNAICPGPFLTPMNEPIAETPEAKQFIVGATALQRWGRMPEIQGAVLFLASDASSYCTGGLYMVDGGWTTR